MVGETTRVAVLPIGPEGIDRAAEELVAVYGPAALFRAAERARDLRVSGLDSLAEVWELIAAVLQDQADSRRHLAGKGASLDLR